MCHRLHPVLSLISDPMSEAPQTATDPKTGEMVELVNGKWVPVQTATNPKTGARAHYVAGQWVESQPGPKEGSFAWEMERKMAPIKGTLGWLKNEFGKRSKAYDENMPHVDLKQLVSAEQWEQTAKNIGPNLKDVWQGMVVQPAKTIARAFTDSPSPYGRYAYLKPQSEAPRVLAEGEQSLQKEMADLGMGALTYIPQLLGEVIKDPLRAIREKPAEVALLLAGKAGKVVKSRLGEAKISALKSELSKRAASQGAVSVTMEKAGAEAAEAGGRAKYQAKLEEMAKTSPVGESFADLMDQPEIQIRGRGKALQIIPKDPEGYSVQLDYLPKADPIILAEIDPKFALDQALAKDFIPGTSPATPPPFTELPWDRVPQRHRAVDAKTVARRGGLEARGLSQQFVDANGNKIVFADAIKAARSRPPGAPPQMPANAPIPKGERAVPYAYGAPKLTADEIVASGGKIPVVSDAKSRVPVMLEELEPFTSGRAQDIKWGLTKVGGTIKSVLQNPYRVTQKYAPIQPLMEAYNASTDTIARGAFQLKARLREFEKTPGLRKDSRKVLMAHMTAEQPGGEMAVKLGGLEQYLQMPESPSEAAIHKMIKEDYAKVGPKINEARVKMGQEPIPLLDNYSPFTINWDILDKADLSVLTDPKDVIETTLREFNKPVDTMKWQYEKRTGAPPVIQDAFKAYEMYMRRANTIIGLAPTVAKGASWLHDFTIPTPDGKGQVFRLRENYPNLHIFLRSWVDAVAGKRYGSNHPLMKGLEHGADILNRHISRAVMSGNVRTTMIQPTSLRNSLDSLGYKYTIEGMVDNLSPTKRKFAMEYSDVLRQRNSPYLYVEELDRTRFKTMGDVLFNIGKKGSIPLQALDLEAARATWLGAYRRAIDLGKDHRAAFKHADQITLLTQSSGAVGHRPAIQQTPTGRLLTQFQNFGINEWNHIVEEVFGKGTHISGLARATNIVRFITATSLVNAVFEDVLNVRSPFPNPMGAVRDYWQGQEDPSALGAIGAGLKEAAETVPVVGGAIRWSDARGRTSLPAAAQTVSDLFTTTGKVLSGKIKPRDLEVLFKIAGVPMTSQAFKTFSRLSQGKSLWEAIIGTKTEIEKPQSGPSYFVR